MATKKNTKTATGGGKSAKGKPVKGERRSAVRGNGRASPSPAAANKDIAASADAREDISAFLSRLQIVAQYLKDLSFESPNAPRIFSQAQGVVPQFSLDINVKPQRLAPQRHEVTLILKVAMQRGDEVCFLVEIVYAALVAVPEEVEAHPLLQAMLLIEVPRLLFPYARNILSELTQSSGFPPLVVQPVDFAALYRKHMAEAATAQKQA